MGKFFSTIVDQAQASFIQVTVFVGLVLLLVCLFDYYSKGRFINLVKNAKKSQVLLGALLGLSPGCGGAIFVMPLFVSGYVTFGTVVATLIATMGDSAFVIMTQKPLEYLMVSGLSFVTAIATGYVVDYFKVGQKLQDKIKAAFQAKNIEENKIFHEAQSAESNVFMQSEHHLGHVEGDLIDKKLHHNVSRSLPSDISYKITHNAYFVYWTLLAVGLVFGVWFLIDGGSFQSETVGKYALWFGTIGTFASIAFMILAKHFIADDSHEEMEHRVTSLKETLIHSAEDTAFVGTWVFVAYLLYVLLEFFLGGGSIEEGKKVMTDLMQSAGFIAVIAAALVGLIPGCGPQVILVSLYVQGMLPFSALLANAISQDGDALIPLIALNTRSALLATIVTTIPAIVIGLFVYWIETIDIFPF